MRRKGDVARAMRTMFGSAILIGASLSCLTACNGGGTIEPPAVTVDDASIRKDPDAPGATPTEDSSVFIKLDVPGKEARPKSCTQDPSACPIPPGCVNVSLDGDEE
jgi:hypothetical protein